MSDKRHDRMMGRNNGFYWHYKWMDFKMEWNGLTFVDTQNSYIAHQVVQCPRERTTHHILTISPCTRTQIVQDEFELLFYTLSPHHHRDIQISGHITLVPQNPRKYSTSNGSRKHRSRRRRQNKTRSPLALHPRLSLDTPLTT